MATEAEAKVDVDEKLEELLTRWRDLAKEESTARLKGEQFGWMMPEIGDDWEGDLFATNDYGKPFDRADLNDKVMEALKDEDSPGTTGDLMLGTLQIDYLACMQRAFTARHGMRRPRALMQAMARKSGHGNDRGPLIQGILEHMRSLAALSKSK